MWMVTVQYEPGGDEDGVLSRSIVLSDLEVRTFRGQLHTGMIQAAADEAAREIMEDYGS